MKKIGKGIALLLVLVMSCSTAAFAKDSPVAPPASGDTSSSIPVVDGIIKIISTDTVEEKTIVMNADGTEEIVTVDNIVHGAQVEGGNTAFPEGSKLEVRDRNGALMDTIVTMAINHADDTLRALVPMDGIHMIPIGQSENIRDEEKRQNFQDAYQDIQEKTSWDDLADVSIALRDAGHADVKAEDLITQYFFNLDLDELFEAQLEKTHGGYLLMKQKMNVKPGDVLIVLIRLKMDPNGNPSEDGEYGWGILDPSRIEILEDGTVLIQYPYVGPVAILTKAEAVL